MVIDTLLDVGAKMPTKAHETDAGFDLYTPVDVRVGACGSTVIDTGVHMAIPNGYVGFLKSKSGLNVNHDLEGEGVIDSGYTGSIRVKLYNHSNRSYDFAAGDKIIQIVILPIPYASLKQVNFLNDTDRGERGFGSTGK